MMERWPAAFSDEPTEPLQTLFGRVIDDSNHLHHPRFMGHQVAAPVPAAALAEFVAAFLNNGMAVYEMGPATSVMERQLARFLAARLQMPASADAVFTSGGSLGNLTALLAARQARAGFDVWHEGAREGASLAVLVGGHTHYSVKRAVQVMGLGADAAVSVPVDERFRMRADALTDALKRAEDGGRRVFAVVASAGSTATGAHDRLEPVADFCERHALWMHVDAAHGGSAAFSARYRSRLAGIERADSVVWDLHKLALLPALVTAVVFKEQSRSYAAFAQEASYLFAGRPPQEEWMNSAVRTLECTKRMMVLEMWAVLSACGEKLLEDYVDHTYALATSLASRIASDSELELAVDPETNIVCFRHLPPGVTGEELDAHNARVRERLVEGGEVYIVQTRLPAGLFLRVTLMNALTDDGDLERMIAAVKIAAGRS